MRLLRTAPLLLMLLLAVGVPPASAQGGGPIYVVEEGDTLFGIALVFGTTVEELAAANSIEDPSSIFPGQELLIPGFEELSGTLQFADLEFGESLESLSLKLGAGAPVLARLNRVVNPDRLYAGQNFVYPDTSATGSAMPSSRRGLILAGSSLLEVAIRLGTDPWNLRRVNGLNWGVPGDLVFAPGDGSPTRALPPEIETITLRPLPAVQGRTSVVEIRTATTQELEVQLGDHRLAMMQLSPTLLIGLQGIHALADPGLQPLSVRLPDGYAFEQSFQVAEGNYNREALIVPEETLDPANTGPEDQLIAELVSHVSPDKRWSGPFSFPTDFYEAFPSLFGTRRSYNGSAFVYYHTGLDLYGSTSTPVLAPAAGRVAYTDFLTVRGKVTYIDHGWGVYSGFLHQSEVLVQAGDMIVPGQIIGYVGGTGRVTGPHLHWEVWVGGVPVNPLGWTQAEFP